MDVDKYFEHMEKVVHGTKFVDLEYDNQFGHMCGSGGKGFQCPKCKIGFHLSGKKAKDKDKECPACGNVFSI